jgi:hypothetical protein
MYCSRTGTRDHHFGSISGVDVYLRYRALKREPEDLELFFDHSPGGPVRSNCPNCTLSLEIQWRIAMLSRRSSISKCVSRLDCAKKSNSG